MDESNRKDVHSIVNNLRYMKAGIQRADQMKFALRRMKEKTGMSEQAMIMRMLWYAFENDSFFEGHREAIGREWQSLKGEV